MKYTWYYYTSKVEEKTVDDIVQRCLNKDLIDGAVGQGNSTYAVDKAVRKSKISFLDRVEDSSVYDLVYNLGMEANLEVYGFDINWLETCQFTLYNSDDKGKYDWHSDLSWLSDKMYHRKMSVVIQLSEPSEYEGGKFEIRGGDYSEQDKINMMKKGSVITFPAFIEHRVTPVTKGKRMSLIGWLLGAKFR